MIRSLPLWLGLLTLWIGGCKGHGGAERDTSRGAGANKTAGPVVDVLVARPVDMTRQLHANGTILALESVALEPEIPGKIVYLQIPEGQPVRKGTILARLRYQDLVAQQRQTRVQLDLARRTRDRYERLLALDGLNQADYDLVLSQVATLEAQMETLAMSLEKTIIRAPFDGVVGLRQISLGAQVAPGTVIATLQRLDQLRVDFTLPATYREVIRPGRQVRVKLSATDSMYYPARVMATETGFDEVTRNLRIRALLYESGGKRPLAGGAGAPLEPGMFVDVEIDERADIAPAPGGGPPPAAGPMIALPTSALIPEDRFNIVVLYKGGMARHVRIETGPREQGRVQIRAGVNVGDTVIVGGVLFAQNGRPVRLRHMYPTLDSALSVLSPTL